MTIEEYLEELERRLPRGPRRRRIRAEVADHLAESAQEVGEAEAVRRFGTAAEVAARFSRTLASAFTRLAALVLVPALAFPIVTYPLVENGLPPAPWPSAAAMPSHLAWKQDAIGALLLVALGAAASGAIVWASARHALLAPVLVAQGALTAAAMLALILSIQWAQAVPGTPGWLLALPTAMLAIVAVSGTLLGRALLLR